MARTAQKTASILTNFYDETFGNKTCEPFRITWPQLRSLAGVSRLDDSVLKEISEALGKCDYVLVPCGDFLLLAADRNLSRFRQLPDRLLEKHLPLYSGDADDESGDDDLDDDE